jgi:hypothetical protein
MDKEKIMHQQNSVHISPFPSGTEPLPPLPALTEPQRTYGNISEKPPKPREEFESWEHPESGACTWCWRKATWMMRCSQCKTTFYCSVECQKNDWQKNHHYFCHQSAPHTFSSAPPLTVEERRYMAANPREWLTIKQNWK